MMSGALRVAAATAAFAVLHSVLASRKTKQTVAGAIGRRNHQGLYRSLFVGQSLVASAALAEYIRRQPDQSLYDLPAPWKYPLRAGQVACLGMTLWAAREAGIPRQSGWESLTAWKAGDSSPVEPVAQGPSADASGELNVRGPFRWSRHPLNFWPWLLLLLNPRMSVNVFTFAAMAGGYLALGSLHEESRLLSAHGAKYARYQRSGISFYLPRFRLPRLSRELSRSGIARHDRRGIALR